MKIIRFNDVKESPKYKLKDLWYSYQADKNIKADEESEKILDTLIANEEKLDESLTEEQKDILKIYCNCISELGVISAQKAFIMGVRFATRYLFEALQEDSD